MIDFIYDTESFPNCFLLGIERSTDGQRWIFEISPWRNDSKEIIEFVRELAEHNIRMVGFNNVGYDYPLLHMILRMGNATAETIYQRSQAILNASDNDRWTFQVYPSDRVVSQLDLYKIHHFDNKARATSLKVLEFNMRLPSVAECPIPWGTVLTQDQVTVVRDYLHDDLTATRQFYEESKEKIKFREELSHRYGRDFMNHNDTKIGKDYFIMRLEEAGVQCYEYGPDGRTPRQTPRPQIALKDAILPWIQFENPEFQRVLEWLKGQTITETKGVFKDLTAQVGGVDFVFGLGGIHASVESETFESNEDMVILDIDVEAYYPSTAIAQRFRPAHYPETFCDIYADLKEQRKQHPKGTVENAMLKLALNGVYGDSNNPFSVFYDPLMTMSITLNGQLLLCLLAERLLNIQGLRIIQVNTDGMTVYLPRCWKWLFDLIVSQWEDLTCLTMEEAEYSRMFVRDVNNYIAEYE